MTVSEAQEMLTAIQHEEIAPIVYTTLYYGLRKSEALSLKWSAVDFQNNTISIEFTVVKNKSIIEKASTKTESSCRKYELIPEIKTLLQQLKIEQEKNRINNPLYCQNDYVFKHADGTPFRPDCLTRSFQRALARAGFPNMRFHDLRHSTASILADKGWDINSIKDWLGHSDIKTTANIYTHISHQRKITMARDLYGMLTMKGT